MKYISSSQLQGVLGVLVALFGAAADPRVLNVLPARWSVAITVAGIFITLFSERVQKGLSSASKRMRAATKDEDRRYKHRHHRRALAFACVVLLVSTACDGGNIIRSFRVALAASGPLVNSLVDAGAIDRTRAAKIIADFGDGALCADTLQSEFAAIAKGDPEAKQKKLNASVNALRCFRVVVNRQNFAANPRVQNVANIAEGILASLVVFYSEPGAMRASAVGTRSTVSARDEKELEKQLSKQVDELKRALEP